MMGQYTNDLKKMAELKAFVDRFRYKATKARQIDAWAKNRPNLINYLNPEHKKS